MEYSCISVLTKNKLKVFVKTILTAVPLKHTDCLRQTSIQIITLLLNAFTLNVYSLTQLCSHYVGSLCITQFNYYSIPIMKQKLQLQEKKCTQNKELNLYTNANQFKSTETTKY